MTTSDLKTIFEKEYDRSEWTNALRGIFHLKNLRIVPEVVKLGENTFGATAYELGSFETSEGLLVGLYEVNITPELRLERNKVGLRNLMRKVYTNDADAALIVFNQGTTWRFTYASELTVENKETGKRERRQTDPKRYTYIFGKHQLCRTAAERFGSIKPSNLLEAQISIKEIEKAFSVDALTKDFYKELSNWYFWALQHVQFPDDAEKDAEIRNSTNTIRLITRLIFVWFLKQKGLIPEVLFEKEKVFALLKDPARNKSTFYKAILQNLFFATLNQEMGKRSFRKDGQNYNITNLFRYEKLFNDPSVAIEIFKVIPFLNGGLFECLDKPHPTEKTPQGSAKIVRVDGFTDRDDNKIVFPDFLFFGGADGVDLSSAYGDTKQKNLKIRGIIEILNSYNFTVEENTPLEIQVALDPELLGQVFENLLASYNPETKTTARKQTGSFYTPREIVNYMVDESLIAYLHPKLSNDVDDESVKKGNEAKLHELVSYSGNENPFDANGSKVLVKAINEIKVLDPACGSGAFPMGVLQQLVHVLQKLDPDNTEWKKLQMLRVQSEIQSAVESGDTEGFSLQLKEIAETFENNSQDYGRKLFLIENCIYGVDIQPIAVQIAKLRFFISLLCEQNIANGIENLGIRALPNLETKFVAANSLIGLDNNSTFKPVSVYALEKELEEVRHRHFSARTPETKRKYRDRDHLLRKQIANELIDTGFPPTSADLIANWNPYDQNTHAPFFDKYWMFGIEDGFDVVIGNPPYINISNLKPDDYRIQLRKNYRSSKNKCDTYAFFLEQGFSLLNFHGTLSYIIPQTWKATDSFSKLREIIFKEKSISKIVDLEFGTFDAIVKPMVVVISNVFGNHNSIEIFNDSFEKISEIKVSEILQDSTLSINTILNSEQKTIFKVIEKDCIQLEKIVQFSRGIKTSDDNRFIFTEPNGEEYKKVYRGKNIRSFQINWNGEYIRYRPDLMKEKVGSVSYTKDFFEVPEKLVTQRVNSSMQLLCAYDDNQNYFLDTANLSRYETWDKKTSLKYLGAILNSKVINYWYCNKYLMPTIGIYELHTIPIKKVNQKDELPFIILVDQILTTKAANPNADTTLLERRIDELVYKLYDLTYNEVKVVDPGFWLSSEEYGNVRLGLPEEEEQQ